MLAPSRSPRQFLAGGAAPGTLAGVALDPAGVSGDQAHGGRTVTGRGYPSPPPLRPYLLRRTGARTGCRELRERAAAAGALAAENAELRRVNEVLRAASAYFASEIGPTRRWS